LLLLQSARRHDPVLVQSLLGTLHGLLCKLPPQSLTASNGFTPEISRCLEPVFEFLRTLSGSAEHPPSSPASSATASADSKAAPIDVLKQLNAVMLGLGMNLKGASE
jgi:hypothetical protein